MFALEHSARERPLRVMVGGAGKLKFATKLLHFFQPSHMRWLPRNPFLGTFGETVRERGPK